MPFEETWNRTTGPSLTDYTIGPNTPECFFFLKDPVTRHYINKEETEFTT